MKETKIIAISDSHGRSALVREVAKIEKPYDLMIHCGDLCDPGLKALGDETGIPFLAVRGNCDSDSSLPAELNFEEGGKRFFVSHGHSYGVKWGTREILARGIRNGADIVFFGHTHEPLLERDPGSNVYILNPGSIAQPRQRGRQQTYAVITITADGEIKITIKSLEGGY